MKPFTVVCDSRISGSCGLRHIAQYPGIPLDGGCQVRRRSTEVVSPCNISYSFSGRRGSADQLHAREMKLCPGYHGVNSRENGRDNTARRPLLRMPGHGSGRVLPIVARASMAACASAAPLQRESLPDQGDRSDRRALHELAPVMGFHSVILDSYRFDHTRAEERRFSPFGKGLSSPSARGPR